MKISASIPPSPEALQSSAQTNEAGGSSEVAQAAALKVFKQSTEAEPKAALDLLSKTLAPGVGTKLNIVA